MKAKPKHGAAEARAADEAAAGTGPLCVLVVDDDRVDRMAARRHLARAGFSVGVAEAEGVLEAIGKLATERFDCVLLDFNLPDGDGLTFLLGMRNAGISVPVIMLTGQASASVAVDLMAAGAADYIPKAELTPERLLQSIRKVIAPGPA